MESESFYGCGNFGVCSILTLSGLDVFDKSVTLFVA
jgi:hypothetical protein